MLLITSIYIYLKTIKKNILEHFFLFYFFQICHILTIFHIQGKKLTDSFLNSWNITRNLQKTKELRELGSISELIEDNIHVQNVI